MKIPQQSRKRGSINERLHLFAKDEKAYPFLSIGSCSDQPEKGTLFLSILLSLKTIVKSVTPKKKKKTERGEFITPPRPTGRRSN